MDDPKMIVFDKDPDDDDTLSVTGGLIVGGYTVPSYHEIDITKLEKEGWQKGRLKMGSHAYWTLPPIQGPFKPPTRWDRIRGRLRRWTSPIRTRWWRFGC